MTRVVIVGAGPCGLACGRELARLGHSDWTIYEQHHHAGGHASSVVDAQGFTWDLGGHVVFSHFGEFDALLDEVMGEDVYEHERSSFVRFDGRWVPYPFQNNLRYLEPDVAFECLVGLIEANGATPATDFAAWMSATFGEGITRRFLRPYNEKVWATPPEEMSADWIAERVSVVDYKRALANVLLQREDTGWGPNNTFRFPRSGGTGEIYRRIAQALAPRVAYGKELMRVDAQARTLEFTDGSADGFDALISTMPLDRLVASLDGCPAALRAAADTLVHTSVAVVGVGAERPLADDRSWLYFPGADVPFYRVTNFAKYAHANVPGGDVGRFSSYLTETAHSAGRPLPDEMDDRVVAGLVRTGLLETATPLASVTRIDVEYAYPVPTVGRDAALDTIQPWLAAHGIYSRGRFGSWRYEIGNMDHAAKMGIDIARHVVSGVAEELWAA